MTKVLWTVDMGTAARQAQLLADAQAIGATVVCIRSDNVLLPGAIPTFHAAGIAVRAWRWPAVMPGPHTAPHYYAMDEAAYITGTLMPAGLDGYIIDAESDPGSPINAWDGPGTTALANAFCNAITGAVAAGTPTCPGPFTFGVTAGCRQPSNNPGIPWAVFAAACDAVYPQAYWRAALPAVTAINGGTPALAQARAIAAWTPIAGGDTIRCMAGELNLVTAAEITGYGAACAGQDELHFYTDVPGIDPGVLAAANAL